MAAGVMVACAILFASAVVSAGLQAIAEAIREHKKGGA